MRGNAGAHCEGSLGSNAFSESSGIGSPAWLVVKTKKAPAAGSLCLLDIEE
jgi:hypothetical protein